MEITKEQFIEYEKVRQSGRTNMFMITNVCGMSGLDKEVVAEIMRQYSELDEKFPDVRETNWSGK